MKMKYYWARHRSGGFTLLEIIIIIGIMGFLTAMIVPVSARMAETGRIRMTQERLEVIRTAIIGPQDVFDRRGGRVVGGYAGDLNALPKLYASVWDDINSRWVWLEIALGVATGEGQPRGLWERGTVNHVVYAHVYAPDYTAWRGPYLSHPRDPFPGDTRHLQWARLEDRELFERRQVEGKLSDAWGNVLYFIKEGSGLTASLLLISAGPDGEILLPAVGAGGVVAAYNREERENRDNIMLAISHTQWYSAGLEVQEAETRRLLDGIRTALLGPPDAFDPSGRRIVGGYLGNMGQWPTLWRWQDPIVLGARGAWVPVLPGVRTGQPRGLWVWNLAEGYSDLHLPPPVPLPPVPPPVPDTGFRWRGPYLSTPWGTGAEEVLRDSWGTALRFELDATTLTITSAGRDRRFGTVTDVISSGDNISDTIRDTEWKIPGMAVRGQIVNSTARVYEKVYRTVGEAVYRQWRAAATQPPDAQVTIHVYHSPAPLPPLPFPPPPPNPPLLLSTTIIRVPAGESRRFELALPAGGAREFRAGARRLVVLLEGRTILERDVPRTVFIGVGGTQSPAEGKLVIVVRSPPPP